MWANLDPGAMLIGHGIDQIDLQTALTHEFGHFIGLAHTCVDTTGVGSDNETESPTSGEDDQGNPIPDCTDPPDQENAAAAEAVMWFQVASVMNSTSAATPTAKRVLSTDDARGVCAIYPPAQDPHSCTQNLPDDGCGCAIARRRSGRLAGLALAAMALALAGGRRRPRQPS